MGEGVGVAEVNVAVTLLVPFMVTSHVALPEQSSPQAVKAESVSGEAVSVTFVPFS